MNVTLLPKWLSRDNAVSWPNAGSMAACLTPETHCRRRQCYRQENHFYGLPARSFATSWATDSPAYFGVGPFHLAGFVAIGHLNLQFVIYRSFAEKDASFPIA